MFLALEQTDMTSLRQGDILSVVPFPIIDDELAILGRPTNELEQPHPTLATIPREHRARQDCFTAQIKMRLGPCAVVSHCCDLELRHGNPNCLAITVARMIPIKASILNDAVKSASLKGNKDPRNIDDPGYIDYFYVEPHPAMGTMEWVVDFGQVSSLPGYEYRRLLARKVLQFDDRTRLKFKIKLASYVGRLTDEEAALGIENPWDDAPAH